ncbi:scavenger mRNA decapping enzyme [Crepidotus variabilis]|uniref:Scavenger mRNA decapping enzyme n=1 Tax=Crepidotus variabilis TaxID=179855 RepID=A0A9P6JLP4_9AGAR|nr:scavenger mRNA decapping enzyme [Crepidotus variabilis]
MPHSPASWSLESLNEFESENIINEDPVTHSLVLLGSFPDPDKSKARIKAIVRVERTALATSDAGRLFGVDSLLKRVKIEGSTDIYTWLFAWLGEDRERDLKINIICPATEVHIRKYTKQQQIMVHETPKLYESHVKPYITSFPPSRTQWVENILTGVSEQDKILYKSSDFVILPDMKWDLTTVSSLYLVALVQDRSIRSLRDLNKKHVNILKSIKKQAATVVKRKWGLGDGSLRMYIHYQPSYYIFHVHIVNVNFEGGLLGMTVGQAHLLDDIISLLELDPSDGPSTFQKMTLTYGLGEQHGLYDKLRHCYDHVDLIDG